MRLLLVLGTAALLSFLTFRIFKRARLLAFIIAGFAALFSFVILTAWVTPNNSNDGWCGRYHGSNSHPPQILATSMDYFELANYEYDKGNCREAVEAYTKSIELNPSYAQSYNNRAYTYMRLREFDKALADLNMALTINPNYVNALRNRADVYSKIPDYQKAEADYERAIELGNKNDLCGDLFTARNDGDFWKSLLNFPIGLIKC